MGFGWLFVGYLSAYFFSLSAGFVSFECWFLLVGCLLMGWGLFQLRRYHHPMLYPLLSLCPLTLVALWQCISAPEWTDNLLIILHFVYHALLFWGLYTLAEKLDYGKLRERCLYNGIFTLLAYFSEGVYAFLWNNAYFHLFQSLLSLVMIVLNSFLLFRCLRTISPETEPEKKGIFSKVNDKLNAETEKAEEKLRQEAVERARENMARKTRK